VCRDRLRHPELATLVIGPVWLAGRS
jgi:hypothetical protein